MSKSSYLLTLLLACICLIAFGCGGGTRGTNGPKNRTIMGTVTNQDSAQTEIFSATVTVSTKEGEFTVLTDPETGFYQVEIEVQNDEPFSISVDSEVFAERSFMIEPAGEEDVISANFEYDGQNVKLVTGQSSSNQTNKDNTQKEELPTATPSQILETVLPTPSITPNPGVTPDPSIMEEPELFITRFLGVINSQYASPDQSSVSVAVSTGIYNTPTDATGGYQLEVTREALLEQVTISIASADVRKSFSIGTVGPVELYELDFAIDQNGEISMTDRSAEGESESPTPSESPSPSPSIAPSTTATPIKVPDSNIKPIPTLPDSQIKKESD